MIEIKQHAKLISDVIHTHNETIYAQHSRQKNIEAIRLGSKDIQVKQTSTAKK